jgi:hypothetical protein
VTASQVAANLAYVGLCLAAACVLVPAFRYWLQREMQTAVYRVLYARWQLTREPVPEWVQEMARRSEELPPEEP